MGRGWSNKTYVRSILAEGVVSLTQQFAHMGSLNGFAHIGLRTLLQPLNHLLNTRSPILDCAGSLNCFLDGFTHTGNDRDTVGLT